MAGIEGAFVTVVTVSIAVAIWWFLVLKPRMKRYVAENTKHVAAASVEVRHTHGPRLRPDRILVIAELPEPTMEHVHRRLRGSTQTQRIADADMVIAIGRSGKGRVIKDREGIGSDGFEVDAILHRLIEGKG